MYIVLLRVEVLPGRADDYRALAGEYAAACLREEPGTLRFEFVQDEADERRFTIIEGYADRAAYEAHRTGAVGARLGPRFGPLLAGAPTHLARGYTTAAGADRS